MNIINIGIILIITVSLLMAGCSRIESFDTKIERVKDNYIEVDCSDEVKNTGDEDIGYVCFVQITNKTIFRNETGEQLSAQDFTRNSNIRVILDNPKYIQKSKESREIVAKEIILIKQ